MKSHYSLWTAIINGEKRWGVNELRPYGLYTKGPHDGFDTKDKAVALLKTYRMEERQRAAEIEWMNKHKTQGREP